jgi:hypothetical protein
MSKSASHRAKGYHRPAPEVLPLIQASHNRILMLLQLCDHEIKGFVRRVLDKASSNASFKEVQAVARTVLSLQKALDQYASILFPSTPHTEMPTATEGIENTDLSQAELADLIDNPSSKKFSEEFFKRRSQLHKS